MTLTSEAIYEDGVLKPMQPLALPEGTHVSVVIEAHLKPKQQSYQQKFWLRSRPYP